jgi:hypothetical protein
VAASNSQTAIAGSSSSYIAGFPHPQSSALRRSSSGTSLAFAVSVNADRPDNIEDALQTLARERVEVVIVPQTNLFVVKDAQIASSALEKRR